jgi:hypothetical protein
LEAFRGILRAREERRYSGASTSGSIVPDSDSSPSVR